MTDKRYQVGIWVTLTYVVALAIYAYVQRGPVLAMEPNEFGDALAGAASPLAFLWLVLGYLQQGDELRQNTEALRLQATELKNSVEQQAGLVELGRQQLREQQSQYLASIKPRFNIKTELAPNEDGAPSAWFIYLTNVGAMCTQFSSEISEKFRLTNNKLQNFNTLYRLKMRLEEEEINEAEETNLELRITYMCRDAVPEQARYLLRLAFDSNGCLQLNVASPKPEFVRIE